MLNIPLSDNTIHEKREGWHAPNLSQVTTILIWFIQGHKDPTEQLLFSLVFLLELKVKVRLIRDRVLERLTVHVDMKL